MHADPSDTTRHLELAYKTDGILLILGALLDSVLGRHKGYKESLQSIAQEHILPLFSSQFPFLRAKAAWLAGVLVGEVEFTTGSGLRKRGEGELFDQLFDCVLRCMKDTCDSHSPLASPGSWRRTACCSLHNVTVSGFHVSVRTFTNRCLRSTRNLCFCSFTSKRGRNWHSNVDEHRLVVTCRNLQIACMHAEIQRKFQQLGGIQGD
jgi:hypothetical protein